MVVLLRVVLFYLKESARCLFCLSLFTYTVSVSTDLSVSVCVCFFPCLSCPLCACLCFVCVSVCLTLSLILSPYPTFPVFYLQCVVIDFGWRKMNIVMFPEMDNQCLLWIWRQCLMSTPSCPTFCSECSVCHFCVSIVINPLVLLFCFGRSLPHNKRINQFAVCAFH